MSRLRLAVTLLLCLIVPMQGFAALGYLTVDCPMQKMDHTGMHHCDDCAMVCCKTGDTGNAPKQGCDACANCALCSVFMSVSVRAEISNYTPLPAPRHDESILDSLNLFAIWRPPILS
jgi:hypothetical protein